MVIEKKVVIKNKMGLHARPAALFVQIANKFDCEITVRKGGETVNGKSIMGIMMLAANRGSRLIITAVGSDAEAAMAELEGMLAGDLDDTVLRSGISFTKRPENRPGAQRDTGNSSAQQDKKG